MFHCYVGGLACFSPQSKKVMQKLTDTGTVLVKERCGSLKKVQEKHR